MRQWIAIGAAVGLVAVTLPLLRKQDDELARHARKGQHRDRLVRGADHHPRGDAPSTGGPGSRPRIDDRGDVAVAPAFGTRKAELTLNTKYQRAALGLLREGHVPEGAVVMTDVKTGACSCGPAT